MPGKMALLICFANASFIMITPPRGPRRPLCVVLVTTSANGIGARVLTACNEAGIVGHVDHEVRADVLGYPGEALEVDAQAVGRRTGDDELRFVLVRQAAPSCRSR